MNGHDLFTLPLERIDFDVVRNFVLRMEAANALTESLVLELKSAPDGRNIVKAVAGLANTDGGLILVGVSEEAGGDARLVGVDTKVVESLVGQFRALLGPDVFEFVEIIPVAKPEGGSIVIVVRVDADMARRPVVISGGTVLVRAPGQTVGARRDEIVALVGAQQVDSASVVPIPHLVAPTDAMRFPFWADESQPELAVRLNGRVQLPGRALRRPWLSSAAQHAAITALNEGPIPDHLQVDHVRGHEMTRSNWEITDAYSSRFRLKSRTTTPHPLGFRPRFRGEAYLYREHRVLGLLLVIGIDRPADDAQPKPLRVQLKDLYDCILASCMAISDTCRAVAAALDADSPLELGVFEGWLQPLDSTSGEQPTASLTDLLMLHDWTPPPPRDLSAYLLSQAIPETGDLVEMDGLARTWLNLLWLDLGLRDFENAIAALTLPSWTASEAGPTPTVA